MRLLSALITDDIKLGRDGMDLSNAAKSLLVLPFMGVRSTIHLAVVLVAEVDENLSVSAVTTTVQAPNVQYADATQDHLLTWPQAGSLVHPAEPVTLRCAIPVTFTAAQTGRHVIGVFAEGVLIAEVPFAVTYALDPDRAVQPVEGRG